MKLKNILREISRPWETIRRIKRTDERPDRTDILYLAGQIAAKNSPKNPSSIQEAEFRVFSQFSEDGIIQYLIKQIPGLDKSFVEFGVQDYLESNTRFLLMHNGWRGLVLEGLNACVEEIRKSDFGWKYGLKAKCTYVSRENINAIFTEEGFAGELGLLSIDVDGIDWHLWDALNVAKPGIVIVEYNKNFPLDRPVTVPYEPTFDRSTKHYTKWYYGTSLAALHHTATEKGYAFVGVESHCRNAFFVRNDLVGNIPTDILRNEYVDRNARKSMEVLKGMPVYNVVTKSTELL